MNNHNLISEAPLALFERAVLAWPGVAQEPGRFGGTAFMLGRREIGHIHGNGGGSHPIRNGENVDRRLALFRLNDDWLQAVMARAGAADQARPD